MNFTTPIYERIPVLILAFFLVTVTSNAIASSYQIVITVTPSGAGTVFKRGTVIENAEYTHYDLEAIASNGWQFSNWDGDLIGTDNPASIVLDRDLNIICNFIQTPYKTPILWQKSKIQNDLAKGTNISCSGAKVAWQKLDTDVYNDASHVYLWANGVTTFGDIYAHSPSLDNEKIAWTRFDDTDYEIMLKIGTDPRVNITNNDLLDRKPSLHNGKIAFETLSNGEWDIRFWDGFGMQEIVRVGKDNNPSLHNSQIAWQGYDGSDYEIFRWDGAQICQITDNETDDVNPSYHDGKIAWENSGNVLYFDGNEIIAVTNDNLTYSKPSLCEGAIAFEGFDGNDREIFFWDGQRMDPVTQDNIDDMEPSLSRSGGQWTLAWRKEQEVWFGTLDVLRIDSIENLDEGAVELTWRSIKDEIYTAYFSDDEYGDSMTWSIAGDNVIGLGYFTKWIDNGTATGIPPGEVSHRYYKLAANSSTQ